MQTDKYLSLPVLARIAGAMISLVCIVLIGTRIATLARESTDLGFDLFNVPGIAGLAGVYAAMLFLLGGAWALLQPSIDAPRTALIAVYGRSLAAKYLPGNVFHFAGRQVLGARLGARHADIAIASAWEAGLSLIAAVGIGATALAIPAPLQQSRSRLVAFAVVVVVVLVAAVLFRRAGAHRATPRPARRQALPACVLIAGFFLANAGIAAWMFGLISRDYSLTLQVGTLYSLSWAAGYIVPGAPGGIGVREAALVSLLSPLAEETLVISLAIAMRLITTLGDAGFAATAQLIPYQKYTLIAKEHP